MARVCSAHCASEREARTASEPSFGGASAHARQDKNERRTSICQHTSLTHTTQQPHAPRGPTPQRPTLNLFELARGDCSTRGGDRTPRRTPRGARLHRRASAPAEVAPRPPTPAPPPVRSALRLWPRAPSLPVASPRRRTLSSEPPASPSAAAAAALYASKGGTSPAAALVGATLATAAVVSPFALCTRRSVSSGVEPQAPCGGLPRLARKSTGPPCLARKSAGAGTPSLSRRSSSGGGSGGAPPCLTRRSGGAVAAVAAPWHAARAPWVRRPGALTLALARLRGRDRTQSAG